jgi:hypothetical protein
MDFRCEDGRSPESMMYVTISNPRSMLAVKQGLILESEAKKAFI